MTDPRRASCTIAALAAVLVATAASTAAQRDGGDKKPSLSLKATPPAGFAPLRVHGVVDVRGGANDFAEFYCATVQWDWDDGTISENSEDCDPYEAGKSEIKRHFTMDHVYSTSGEYRVEFRLKQKDKIVARGSTEVKVRPGVRDGAFDR